MNCIYVLFFFDIFTLKVMRRVLSVGLYVSVLKRCEVTLRCDEMSCMYDFAI